MKKEKKKKSIVLNIHSLKHKLVTETKNNKEKKENG